MNLRVLDALGGGRARLANMASRMFGGRRDFYKSLGYKRELLPKDYRDRFRRDAVANRIVKALPKATWRGGAEIVEDEEPTKTTTFEAAWEAFNKRLEVWDKFYRADVLAGLGRYAVIVIAAPGESDTPLESAGPEEIARLGVYGEDDATIAEYDSDNTSERYGQPTFYNIKRTMAIAGSSTHNNTTSKRVHWTRVHHMAEGLLDDEIYGEPRLECVWNLLDDLMKVSGAGAEAFWRRADGGMQFDLDPTLDFDEPSKTALKKQLHEYEHDLRRMLLTRGVKVNNLGSAVADFSRPIDGIVSLISAGTGIPQRILMGSERGQLASNQDASNWDDRAQDRRNEWAKPHVRRFIDRMIELGALPEPEQEYAIEFSELRIMDDQQRADIAAKWAALNSAAGEIVVTVDDIRERVLELPPLSEVLTDDAGGGGANAGNTPEERAMIAALERAIATDNTPMLEILLGLSPVVRTIGSGATASALPSKELEGMQAKLAALQAMVSKDDAPMKALAESLVASIKALSEKEAAVINVSPTIQVPSPEKRKFTLKVGRNAKGLLTDSTIEEVE